MLIVITFINTVVYDVTQLPKQSEVVKRAGSVVRQRLTLKGVTIYEYL